MKDNKIINLCEKYPDKFQSSDTYKTFKNENFSSADIEDINIIIAEKMTDIFYLIYQKLKI